MSLLDIDEHLFELARLVELDRSPLTDLKHCGPCDLGLIEGGVCNAENVHVLREFRRNCKTLVAIGACAINGGLPAQRNHLDLGAFLQRVYPEGKGGVPADPELPLLLDKVYPSQILQSHALHFFHLSSPDLLFGFDSEVGRRNILGVAEAHPEIARQGVLLRKFGQEVIRATAGKRIHGTGSIPGGVNRHLSVGDRNLLSAEVDRVVDWCRGAVELVKRLHRGNPALYATGSGRSRGFRIATSSRVHWPTPSGSSSWLTAAESRSMPRLPTTGRA
jgi:hypothetical protein